MKINITDKAINELKKVLEKRKEAAKGVRVYMAGFGWGGPSFGLALDEQKEDDEVEEIDGLKILVDKDTATTFKEFTIDYTNNWLGKGFRVYTE